MDTDYQNSPKIPIGRSDYKAITATLNAISASYF